MLVPCISSRFRHGANLSAENRDRITPLVMAAQNQCTDVFQLLMQFMDQPNKNIFKMMDLKVINGQTMTVSTVLTFNGKAICILRFSKSIYLGVEIEKFKLIWSAGNSQALSLLGVFLLNAFQTRKQEPSNLARDRTLLS